MFTFVVVVVVVVVVVFFKKVNSIIVFFSKWSLGTAIRYCVLILRLRHNIVNIYVRRRDRFASHALLLRFVYRFNCKLLIIGKSHKLCF